MAAKFDMWILLITLQVLLVSCLNTRVRRAATNYPTIANRTACPETTENRPLLRVTTTDRLAELRNGLGSEYKAYIVPSEDAHGSEYPPDYDLRRGYISGFSGSAGTAVITQSKAALWTDGRYFLEADDALDCNWIFMKQRERGVPTITEWLISELEPGDKVGASAAFMMSDDWLSYDEELKKEGISLVDTQDFIGYIWTDGRPPKPNNTINAYPVKYSGKSWQDKVEDVRKEMRDEDASAVIVTDLAEVAWLVTSRSTDINYNPFFVGFAIVELERVRLYINDKDWKLTATPTDPESTETLAAHLNANPDGSCADPTTCVEVKNYEEFYADVQILSNSPNKIWISFSCNYRIYNSIPENKRHQANTPLALMKAKKNPVEIQGMKDCHIRDSAAIMIYISKIEKEVKEGKEWKEIEGADELERIRRTQLNNRGISFETISAVGANGAVIHYRPLKETEKKITTSEMYLLDSGGQYVDGSTDITRTFHFGTPTAKEKEMYTRVLMGSVDLAMAKWPKGLYGRQIDAIARKPLWDVGLVYRHGTGHGLGHYLSIHEGPGRIAMTPIPKKHDVPLDEYMFFSDEPGYYEPGKFGIRLETIVMVDKAKTKYEPSGNEFLGFVSIAMVPFEPHLIDYSLLRPEQIAWINDYHKQCMDKVGPLLKEQNQMDAYRWLELRTKQIAMDTGTSKGTIITISTVLITFVALLHLI